MGYVLVGLAVVFGIYILTRIRVVPQAEEVVIERLGAYHATWNVGLHLLIPFLDKIANKVSKKEQVIDFPPQPVITKDNVTIQVDSIVYLVVMDSKAFTYGVENPIFAVDNLTATTLRNIIGDLELDETLTSRDLINGKMTAILDEATDKWGIKITRVELKNIMPPRSIQDAMERQMKAERERRESILLAEGEKMSRILQAEGLKESEILSAQAKKEAAILHAEADRQSKIKAAEGEAEAILLVQKATADGIAMLNASNPSEQVMRLKGYEAFTEVANGQSTKLIIPSDLQSLVSTVTTVKSVLGGK